MTLQVPQFNRRSVLLAALATVPVTLSGCGRSASPDATPPRREDQEFTEYVEMSVDGDVLRPVTELIEGSAAEIRWLDLRTGSMLGTGNAPVLDIGGVERVGMQALESGSLAFDHVTTLNLGFNRKDDYGRLSLPAGYEHTPQPVTRISDLHLLSGLVRFCASRTPMAGLLDLSGLSALEHVECYGSEIDSIELTGCTSIVRLCVEACRLSELDLQPVRTTLRDLRAAIQRSGEMDFAPLDGPMEALYHYCVREQRVHRAIPHRHLPVVEEYWAWATGQRTCDAPTSPLLGSYLARENPLDQASVDRILTALNTQVTSEPGRVDISGRSNEGAAASPSAPGEAAATALLARGWRVSTN